ncbi:hypothetical protein [Spiroplasma endosymbiont of Aspidapion aeneum]|uniref:hypothetical protein n=1 Tax=Spiroplasma endosymbiont of Aspidapion aeneum TaxID=3066276 RepID=UPI00313AA409
MKHLSDVRYEFEILKRKSNVVRPVIIWKLLNGKKVLAFFPYISICFLVAAAIILPMFFQIFNSYNIYNSNINKIYNTTKLYKIYNWNSSASTPSIIQNETDKKSFFVIIFAMLMPFQFICYAFIFVFPMGIATKLVRSDKNFTDRYKNLGLLNCIIGNLIFLFIVYLLMYSFEDIYIYQVFKLSNNDDMGLYSLLQHILNGYIVSSIFLSFLLLFTILFTLEAKFILIVSVHTSMIILILLYNIVHVQPLYDLLSANWNYGFYPLLYIFMLLFCFLYSYFSKTSIVKIRYRYSDLSLKEMFLIGYQGIPSFIVNVCVGVFYILSVVITQNNNLMNGVSNGSNYIFVMPKFIKSGKFNVGDMGNISFNKAITLYNDQVSITCQLVFYNFSILIITIFFNFFSLLSFYCHVNRRFKLSKNSLYIAAIFCILLITLCSVIVSLTHEFKWLYNNFNIHNFYWTLWASLIILNVLSWSYFNFIALFKFNYALSFIFFLSIAGNFSGLIIAEVSNYRSSTKNDSYFIDLYLLLYLVSMLLSNSFVIIVSRKVVIRIIKLEYFMLADNSYDLQEKNFKYLQLLYKFICIQNFYTNKKRTNIDVLNGSYLYDIETLRLRTEIKFLLINIKRILKENKNYNRGLIANKKTEIKSLKALLLYIKCRHKYLVDANKFSDNLDINKYLKGFKNDSILKNINNFDEEIPQIIYNTHPF